MGFRLTTTAAMMMSLLGVMMNGLTNDCQTAQTVCTIALDKLSKPAAS